MWHCRATPLQSSVTWYPGGRSSTPVTVPLAWFRADELTSLSVARITSDARSPTVTASPSSKSLIGASSRNRPAGSSASSRTTHSMVPSRGFRAATRIGRTFSTPTSRARRPCPGCPSTSNGSPRSSVRPSSITCTVSPSASASSRSWVTMMTGMFARARTPRISPRSVRLSSPSSDENGSSRSSTAGWTASARASATRCACPPDNSHVRRSARSVSRSESSSAPTASPRSALGLPRSP